MPASSTKPRPARRLERAPAGPADRQPVLRAHRAVEEQGGDAGQGRGAKPEDAVTPDDAIKDPYVLEFLTSRTSIRNPIWKALIRRLEDFLLELGEGFTFIGRQRRLRIDQTWYRVDCCCSIASCAAWSSST
jgi:hypothetical protein